MNGIVDITQTLSADGGSLPSVSDGDVWIYRCGLGNITLCLDPGVDPVAASRVFAALAQKLSLSPERESEPDEKNGNCVKAGVSGSDNSSSSLEPQELRGEDVTEDLVRWGDGCTAYKLEGKWWWVRWQPDTGERWGQAGPRGGAVAERGGPFDNFDDTMVSLSRKRSQES